MDIYDNFLHYHALMKADDKPVQINSGGKNSAAYEWKIEASATREWKDMDLWVVVAGQGTLQTGQNKYRIAPGDCFILRGGHPYQIERSPEGPFIHYYIHFNYLDTKGKVIPSMSNNFPPLYRHMDDLTFFSSLLDRTISAIEDYGPNSDKAMTWFRSTLMEISLQDTRTTYTGLEKEQREKIEAICAKLHENPATPISVTDMSKQMHCTTSHFSRIFKKYKGVSPQKFIIRTRITAAKFILRTSSKSIGNIADMLGYRDVYFFSRQFLRHARKSPSAWRKQAR